MQVYYTIHKGCGTSTKIKFPHSCKLFVKHFNNFCSVLLKIFIPAEKCSVIMSSKTLNINSIKSLLSCNLNNLSEAWNNSARENVFFDSCISRMFLQGTDIVEKE